MRVVVASESRFVRTPDGAVWTVDGPAYRFWTQYLSVFDAVRIVARTLELPGVADGARRVDGTDVGVWPVPYYVGPRGYLRQRMAVGRAARTAAGDGDAVILRAPTPVGNLLARAREQTGRPYGVEVIGDPHDVFAPGVIDHPLRPLIRRWSYLSLRRRCGRAAAIAYVTERTLQARYPARPGSVAVACSCAEMYPEAYVPTPRVVDRSRQPDRLISVGGLAQPYKGIDVLLSAMALLRTTLRHVTALHLVHVGDGRHRPELERLAARLGVSRQVTFTGALPGHEAVRDQLDRADLFIMPSRVEGLPMALIEAMGRALPAVATTVGGIPELLPTEHLVRPDDPATLAAAIARLLTDPVLMATASATNLARARDYAVATVASRRDTFYRTVYDATTGVGPRSGRVSSGFRR